MNRYPVSIKYLVVVLAFLHTLAGGHVCCCAHVHRTEIESGNVVDTSLALRYSYHSHPSGRRHSHSHRHRITDESQDSTCCCQDDPCHHDHGCSGSDQQAISAQRGAGETVKQFPFPLSFFVFTVPVTPPSVSTGVRDTVAVSSPALPLRLHLFYGLLLI